MNNNKQIKPIELVNFMKKSGLFDNFVEPYSHPYNRCILDYNLKKIKLFERLNKEYHNYNINDIKKDNIMNSIVKDIY